MKHASDITSTFAKPHTVRSSRTRNDNMNWRLRANPNFAPPFSRKIIFHEEHNTTDKILKQLFRKGHIMQSFYFNRSYDQTRVNDKNIWFSGYHVHVCVSVIAFASVNNFFKFYPLTFMRVRDILHFRQRDRNRES